MTPAFQHAAFIFHVYVGWRGGLTSLWFLFYTSLFSWLYLIGYLNKTNCKHERKGPSMLVNMYFRFPRDHMGQREVLKVHM